MPSRTTTKAGTKAPSGKASTAKAGAAKAGNAKVAAGANGPAAAKRKTTDGTLAAAAAAAGRKQSVKAAQTEQRTAAPVPNAAAAGLEQGQGQADRQQMVAEAAYYRAQNRDFAPGHELDDWLDAEAEIARHAPGR